MIITGGFLKEERQDMIRNRARRVKRLPKVPMDDDDNDDWNMKSSNGNKCQRVAHPLHHRSH